MDPGPSLPSLIDASVSAPSFNPSYKELVCFAASAFSSASLLAAIVERGFSFRFDGNLDMGMDQNSKLKAEVILNTYGSEELLSVFRELGEIKNAYKLVKIIVSHREKEKIKTISQFKETIKEVVPKHAEYKYFAKVFQALRIEVNDEISALKEMLIQTGKVLQPIGRLVVITYHSLEDRLVKNYIKAGRFDGEIEKDFYGNIIAPFKSVNRNTKTTTINFCSFHPMWSISSYLSSCLSASEAY